MQSIFMKVEVSSMICNNLKIENNERTTFKLEERQEVNTWQRRHKKEQRMGVKCAEQTASNKHEKR